MGLELGALVGMGVDAAISKPGRKVLAGFAYVFAAGIVVHVLGWWLLPILLGLLALAVSVLLKLRRVLRFATRGAISATPEIRHNLAVRGVPALAHGQPTPALPRAMRRSLTRKQAALPAPVVEPTRIVAPVRRAAR